MTKLHYGYTRCRYKRRTSKKIKNTRRKK